MKTMPLIAALLLSMTSTAVSAQLQVIDHTLGESSGSASHADLARGHSVSLRVSGTPGDAVLLLISPTPPLVPPPLVAGQPLLVDPATMLLLVNGLSNPAAVIGPAGVYDLDLVLPADLPLGLRVWMQAVSVPAVGAVDLGNGVEGEVIQAHLFDFETGAQGWVGDFADLPINSEVFYELGWDQSPLPAPLDPTRSGFRMQGNNHSDDLFMFLKRQVGGLEPGEVYQVDIEVELASSYPASWAGVGGAPGSSVYIHAGASLEEPTPILDPDLDWNVMNILKGNQAMPGEQSHVLGHIGIPGDTFVYMIVERETATPVPSTADAEGKLWLHIGTDSGFESFTEVWYDRLVFRIRQ